MALTKSLSILLLLGVLAVLATFLFGHQGQQTEGFAVRSYSVQDLTLNACPSYASEVQTARGSTDCCQGDLVDGKCNGSTFCTKSPAYTGVKNCTDAWRLYFADKGTNVCPATMRNYYEDVTNPGAAKGCSEGPISADGKRPTDGSKKKCTIYPTETDNKTKPDSCYLEKERSKIQCPVVNRQSPQAMMQVNPTTKAFQYFYCQYPFELGIPDKCMDSTTFTAYYTTVNPNWRTDSHASQQLKESLCSQYIATRNRAYDMLRKLEEERRAREAAEAKTRKVFSLFSKLKSLFTQSKAQASRLQLQLDVANRKAQTKR